MRDMKESWLGLVFPAEINSEKFNRLHDQYSEKEWSARRTSFDVPAILTAGCVLAMLLLLCAPLVEQNKTMFFWTLYIIANGFMGVVLAVFVGWVWHRRRRACRDAVSVADPLFQSRYKLLTRIWRYNYFVDMFATICQEFFCKEELIQIAKSLTAYRDALLREFEKEFPE